MIDIPQITFPSYKLASYLLTPLIPFYLKKRIKKDKEDKTRLSERYGHASQERPTGKLIWLHAASVGELISTLSLLDKINTENPDITLLVTSGTVTSAEIAKNKLPKNVIHQFAPLDSPVFVNRFLNYWKPDLVLWLESEFWPNHLREIKSRQIPAILLNARMSEKSFKRWSEHPKSIQTLLSCFTTLSAQSSKDRDKLVKLAKDREVLLPGNMKLAAQPLSYDQIEYKSLKKIIGKRKIIVAASTHPTEEQRLLDCYKSYASTIEQKPLLIIVPRHPQRGAEVFDIITNSKLKAACRSKNEDIEVSTDIYLADTLGELGLFYALSDIVIMGGSFSGKIGGHNPIEPALLDTAIIVGPDMSNFASITKAMLEDKAIKQVKNDEDLTKTISKLLVKSNRASSLKENAKKWAGSRSKSILKRVKNMVLTHLSDHKEAV
ncbi:3-deoxy-D-manno-octulosonic acid transferase [Curvivirga aplysinae]|uniref:3-deoxy-D-manno-octulosonic acid transferase n=1 Tax=Curvivirga aplysinae TaxID=2529852 RepID=UPI001C3FF1DE|nr:3-deoxy-D-manno-octulosonic acid transferase [Curvivirga aplysinae]